MLASGISLNNRWMGLGLTFKYCSLQALMETSTSDLFHFKALHNPVTNSSVIGGDDSLTASHVIRLVAPAITLASCFLPFRCK